MFYRRTIEPAKKLHMKVNDNIYKVKCFQNVMKSVEKVSIEIYCKWLITLRMNEFFLLSSIFEWFFLSSCSVCDICLLIWEAHWGTFVDMQHLSSSLLSIMYLEVQRTSFQFQHQNSLRKPNHPGNHIHSHFLYGYALT